MNKEAIAAALQKVMEMVNGADMGSLPSMQKPAAPPEFAGGAETAESTNPPETPAECAECKAGTCSDPEHMSDEDAEALAASLK